LWFGVDRETIEQVGTPLFCVLWSLLVVCVKIRVGTLSPVGTLFSGG
jgi:hypothetical protein